MKLGFWIFPFNAIAWSVSVVDISPLFDLRASSEVILTVSREIDKALCNEGVFLATGVHEESFFASSLEAAQALFAMGSEDKTAVSAATLGGVGRGYLSFGSEAGVGEYFEPKEGYAYGYDWPNSEPSQHELQRPNVWPAATPIQVKQSLEDLFFRQIVVAKAIARALDLVTETEQQERSNHREHASYPNARTNYTQVVDGGEFISLMRMFLYFPADASKGGEAREQLGSSPHTDWGFLTLILYDGVPGLQFYHDQSWVDVPAHPNSIVVNGGDVLKLISRGRYKSPIHRVLCPAAGRRLSSVLFFYPRHDTTISADFVDEEPQIDFSFNTLKRSNQSSSGLRFGDYIVNKWRGVLRK